MSKDGPKSGRMGFGFKQAQEAGAPYLRPSSEAEINLEQFLGRRPDLRDQVSKLRAEGKRCDTILRDMREAGMDGEFAIGFARDPAQKDWEDVKYGNDRKSLEEEADRLVHLGVYKAAVLWGWDKNDQSWPELRTWPE